MSKPGDGRFEKYIDAVRAKETLTVTSDDGLQDAKEARQRQDAERRWQAEQAEKLRHEGRLEVMDYLAGFADGWRSAVDYRKARKRRKR